MDRVCRHSHDVLTSVLCLLFVHYIAIFTLPRHYHRYQKHARSSSVPDAEEKMYEALAALRPASQVIMRQPANLAKTIDELREAATTHNDAIHALLKDVVEKAGGDYAEGIPECLTHPETSFADWATSVFTPTNTRL